MKKSSKKKHRVTGDVSPVISKDGIIRYKDASGVFISRKKFIENFIDRGESPEKLPSGKDVTEYKKQVSKEPRIRDKQGRFISGVAKNFLREKAEEKHLSLREFVNKFPKSVDIVTKGKITVDIDAKHIFQKIKEHKGKVYIDGEKTTKTAAYEYFFKQTTEDFDSIKEREKVPPIVIFYESTYDQKTGVLDIPGQFTDYIVSRPNKNKTKRESSKKTKKEVRTQSTTRGRNRKSGKK